VEFKDCYLESKDLCLEVRRYVPFILIIVAKTITSFDVALIIFTIISTLELENSLGSMVSSSDTTTVVLLAKLY
jgi:hypothetical protein